MEILLKQLLNVFQSTLLSKNISNSVKALKIKLMDFKGFFVY